MSVDLFSLKSLLCCLAFFFAGIIDSVCGGGGLITVPTMLAVGSLYNRYEPVFRLGRDRRRRIRLR